MLLTDANVDHRWWVCRAPTGRQVTRSPSTRATRFARSRSRNPLTPPFAREPHAWHTIPLGETVTLDARVEARAVPVDGLTPGYAGRQAIPGAVVAYHLRDRKTGANVLFAPVFAAVTPTLIAAASDADAAFFDGSFWSDEELGDVGVEKAARSARAPARRRR